MSGGEGVRNPADLTPVSTAIEINRLLLLVIQAGVATVLVDLATVDAIVDTILAIVEGLPTLTETGGTLTTDGNEQNVYINDVPLGVFNPVCVKIDFTNQEVTETVVIRTYYRITAGVAAQILQDTLTFAGVVSPELINIDLEPNRFGVRVTMQRTAGNAQDYDWEAFYEI